MEIREKIREYIQKTLEECGLKNAQVELEHPADITHGDYATNVALVYSKERGKNPRQFAEELVAVMEESLPDSIEKVEVAGPGFINFHLSDVFFIENVSRVLGEGENYGRGDGLSGQKIIVEYTNTNVLKPLHIGHLMGNVIGESLSHIFEWSGAEVKRNTYQGDVGLHVAKAVWGIRALEDEKPRSGLSEQIDFIGNAYAYGAQAFEDDKGVQEEIKEINKKMFERSDNTLMELYIWARQKSLDHFEELYKKLGTKFDYYFFESEVEKQALEIAHAFVEKGVLEESEGAIVFKGEKYDEKLHTRVLVNSQGIPTYEGKDVAHAVRKYDTFPADRSIIVAANEQDMYFKVVLKALELMYPEIAKKTEHVSHGMLTLTSGKMASRKGNVITGESLIHDMEERTRAKMEDRDLSAEQRDRIATDVAVAAIKYSILRQGIGRSVVFDPDTSISFEGDSGPYMQYVHTRVSSLLEKAEEEGVVPRVTEGEVFGPERLVARFPEVVEKAGREYAPQQIATYLIELSSAFNTFYAEEKIIDRNDETSPHKLAVAQAVGIVIRNGLRLLGIRTPSKM